MDEQTTVERAGAQLHTDTDAPVPATRWTPPPPRQWAPPSPLPPVEPWTPTALWSPPRGRRRAERSAEKHAAKTAVRAAAKQSQQLLRQAQKETKRTQLAERRASEEAVKLARQLAQKQTRQDIDDAKAAEKARKVAGAEQRTRQQAEQQAEQQALRTSESAARRAQKEARSRVPADAEPAPLEMQAHTCQVVTVFSAKGGTGKTTLATNLATLLHNVTGRRVCLVDLDLAFGDVAICLRLSPDRTLVDAVDGTYEQADQRIDAVLTPYRPGFDCVLAPVAPGDAERIPAEMVAELLLALRTRYDYVVVDTAPQMSEHVLTALDHSDRHLLVATPELPALKGLRLTLDTFDLLKYQVERRAVVFNRADEDTGLRPDEVQQMIGSPIRGGIPASRDVPHSINTGVPLAGVSPDHAVSRTIRQLADRVIPGVAETGPQRPRRRGLRRGRARS